MSWMKRLYAGLNNFNYTLPTDKRQLLYDFYMSSFLFKPQQAYKDDKVYSIVKETKLKLVADLRQELLDDIFFVICCEIRHAFRQTTSNHDEALDAEQLKFLSTYQIARENTNSYDAMEYVKQQGKGLIGTNSPDYERSYVAVLSAIKKYQATPTKFIELARDVFTKIAWHSSYGGKMWGQIADAWLHLDKKTNLGEAQAYIDHIIDLQHNTGSMFNKLKKWSGNEGSFKWIQDVLDHKAKIVSPYDILVNCSPKMKFLAARALHDTDGSDLHGNMHHVTKYWVDFLKANMLKAGMVPEDILIHIPPEQYEVQLNQYLHANASQLYTLPPIIRKHIKPEVFKKAFLENTHDMYFLAAHFDDAQKILTPQEIDGQVLGSVRYYAGNINKIHDTLYQQYASDPQRFAPIAQAIIAQTDHMGDISASVRRLFPTELIKPFYERRLESLEPIDDMPEEVFNQIDRKKLTDWAIDCFSRYLNLWLDPDRKMKRFKDLLTLDEWKKVFLKKLSADVGSFSYWPEGIKNLFTLEELAPIVVDAYLREGDPFLDDSNYDSVLHGPDKKQYDIRRWVERKGFKGEIADAMVKMVMESDVNPDKDQNAVKAWVNFLLERDGRYEVYDIPHAIREPVIDAFGALIFTNPKLKGIAESYAKAAAERAIQRGSNTTIMALLLYVPPLYAKAVKQLLENDPSYNVPIDMWVEHFYHEISSGAKWEDLNIPPAYADKIKAAVKDKMIREKISNVRGWISYIKAQQIYDKDFFDKCKQDIPNEYMSEVMTGLGMKPWGTVGMQEDEAGNMQPGDGIAAWVKFIRLESENDKYFFHKVKHKIPKEIVEYVKAALGPSPDTTPQSGATYYSPEAQDFVGEDDVVWPNGTLFPQSKKEVPF